MLTPLNISVDDETRQVLKARANALGLSISGLIRVWAREPAPPAARLLSSILSKGERPPEPMPDPSTPVREEDT